MSQTSKVGYSTTTYCKKLLVRHLDWIVETKVLYNQVVAFYHNVLLERQEWLSLSNQNLLRQLEILTIGEKRKGIMEAECPIPYKKVPLYFRRAAINTAISLVRSYAAKYQTWKEKKRGLP